ncbi:hypothetical protein FRACYDRAFT_251912 [Fragilariopsis cylindrus CCMP1102]|uniref:Uncharacterized protein n=1 Tax=Fragilariopsis cylindrus CCMP1102 TaxID=635003 RepID=A0A1E7EMF9_9STRA|nr:hypothetical protein FRACYDRAFT_251912 [Fragilariopsis cylindrus CCMP1102]|eukprot:OEU07129.1 hypothetical protein FRACYDRAFT_251912 [Fragilariopsis cylindrus CCMP1102]
MSSITTTDDDDKKQENSPPSDDNIDSQLIAMNNESLNGQIITDCYHNVVNGMNGSMNRFMDGITPPPLLSCGDVLDVYGQEEEWAQEVAADYIEILPDLLCVDRRIVLDTVDFLAGPNIPSSWEEGENLTNTTSGSAHNNEDTDATTNEENDKKSTSNSGLFSSFFGSGISGRTKKKNAPTIRSSTGGHKIRPAWYPKSLIRIRNTKYVRWGECDGSGGIGIGTGIGGDECGSGGEEEKINSILQSYNDDVDVDDLSDSSGDALLLLTLGNINDGDDDFSVVSTPLPPASFTTTMTDNNEEGGQQEHQEDNKSNGGDDINNSIVISGIIEDKRTPEKEEECVMMPSSTISDEKKEKAKEKSTTAPTTAAITTTERDADAATAVVVGGGGGAENEATITAPRPLSSASSFSPDDDNATTLVVTTRMARCGITPARIKRSNHLHGCAAAYFNDVIAPPIVAVGAMKSTAMSALDEYEDHDDDNDYDGGEGEGEDQQSKGEVSDNTRDGAADSDDDVVVVVVDNEGANNPVSVVSNDEVKALVEMVVEISNNKDDDVDDHVSTISTTSKKSTSSIMSVPYLLKASMKRAKKLRKSNNRNNRKLSSSTTTSISFGKAAVAADKKEAETEAEEGTAVAADETEAEAEEGSVTSGRRSVASCSRSIISVAGTNGNRKSMKDPLKDIRLLDRLMKKNDQFKLRVERMEKLDRKAEALEQKQLLNVFASKRSSMNRAMAAEETILGVETGFEVLSMPVGGGGLEEL